MMLTRKEAAILKVLARHPEGLYGMDIGRELDGLVGLGTIYSRLKRLEDAGFVRNEKQLPVEYPGGLFLVRWKHFITDRGRRELVDQDAPTRQWWDFLRRLFGAKT